MAAVALAILTQAAPARAAFDVFTTRAAFDAATTNRSVETFEVDPLTGPRTRDAVVEGPVSATTLNFGQGFPPPDPPVFAPGDIIPNLLINAAGAVPPQNTFFVNVDIQVPGTTVLTTNNSDNLARLDFDLSPVTAFAVDLGTRDAGFDSDPLSPTYLTGTYTILVYAPGQFNTPFQTRTVTFTVDGNTGLPTVPTVFFGFVSDAPVGRVELVADGVETFDNVTLAEPAAAAVPAPGGLALAAVAAPVLAAVRRRRR